MNNELMAKLLKIQAELKAPKNQYNSFGKYSYRNTEGILESLKPSLQKYKCGLTLSDELVMIGDRYYIKATAWLYDIESNENIVIVAYAREEETKKGMDGSQITGASSSYARKYALNGLFLIDDTKDSDSTNEHKDLGGELQRKLESYKNPQDLDNDKVKLRDEFVKKGMDKAIVTKKIQSYLDSF